MEFDNLLHRLRTPIETINILGCGGLRMGTISELWGPPGGGKSTFCYQTGACFQKDYPDGILHLIDAENSYDELRLKYVFGIDIDSKSFIVEPAPTIEEATEKILRGMSRAKSLKVPYLAIIDSWTVLNTNSTMDNIEEALKESSKVELNMHAGAMMVKPKATRHWLNAIMPFMYQAPYSILIINQASTSIGKYVTGISSAGGYGLKHDMQYSFCFQKRETSQAGDVNVGATTDTLVKSEVEVTKSKFMPGFSGIEIFIDVAKGGVIIPKKELIEIGKMKGIISKSGSWYKVPDNEKSFRDSELENIEDLDILIRNKLVENFRRDYFLVDVYYKEKDSRLTAINSLPAKGTLVE